MYQQDPNAAYLLGVDEQSSGYSGIQSNPQIQNVQLLQQQQQQMLHQQHTLLHGVPQQMVQPMVHHPFAMHPQVAHSYGQQLIHQQQYSSSQAQGHHISHNLALPIPSGNDSFAESGDEEKADSVLNSELAVGGTAGYLSDPRLSVFRKLHRTLTSSVLIKSWQRLGILVAGMEAVQEHGQASLSTLEKAIYLRYHGDPTRNPPFIGAARRMVDDDLDILATEQYGIKFPKEKISYDKLVNNLPGHILWRYYKELVSEVCVKINGAYRTCLNHDLLMPEGKTLYDVLEETLQLLWEQNEDTRRDRLKKRKRQLSEGNDAGCNDDDSEDDDAIANNNDGTTSFEQQQQPITTVEEEEGGDRQGQQSSSRVSRPKQQITSLLSPKNFPGVGKFQPFSFLSFLLLGPPAGDKCWSRFALERNPESAPRRPRLTSTVIMPIMDTSVDGYHRAPPPPVLPQQKRRRESEEDSDTIRVFNAETAARAQRLEELKLALSLFPDDDSIKVELKQFIDSQRRTVLSSDVLATTGFQPLLK